MPKWKLKGVLFLDRDGVINEDYGYVCSKERFKFVKGAQKVIKRANNLGLLVIIITNQSGIGRGLYSEKDFIDFMDWINFVLKSSGAHFDAFYYCPHHPVYGKGIYKKNCQCRKPAPGLLKRALLDWNINRKKSILIGDKETDILAANQVDIPGFKFNSKQESLHDFVNKIQIEDFMI